MGTDKDECLTEVVYVCCFNRTSGSESVCVADALFQGIHAQFPGDPWIHLCNRYSKVYVFFKLKE
jgi:hypothetical protein